MASPIFTLFSRRALVSESQAGGGTLAEGDPAKDSMTCQQDQMGRNLEVARGPGQQFLVDHARDSIGPAAGRTIDGAHGARGCPAQLAQKPPLEPEVDPQLRARFRLALSASPPGVVASLLEMSALVLRWPRT